MTTVQEQAILASLTELDRWKRRQDELKSELEKVNRQVAYYEALVRDMKREVRPPRISDLLKSMSTLWRP